MFGKKKPAEPVHIASRSWWSGDVKTLCGIRWTQPEGDRRQVSRLTNSPTCEACKAENKKRWW